MKKCCKYLDSLENLSTDNSAKWQDMLIHTTKCPDCSTDSRFRAIMLEQLGDLPEPDYPADLHNLIMDNLSYEINKDKKQSFIFAAWFNKLLRPMEFAALTCSVIMFIFLIQLDNENSAEEDMRRHISFKSVQKISKKQFSSNQYMKKADITKPETKLANKKLVQVSPAEVELFLDQLNDYNRRRPEETEAQSYFSPELKLVNHLNAYRHW